MSWETKTGYTITSAGRIDRRIIDVHNASMRPPEPPMREVVAWGDVKELVPDHWDPAYVEATQVFHLELLDGHLDLIAGVVEYSPPVEEGWADELMELGTFNEPTEANALRFEVLADANDASRAVGELLYNSTVTARGMAEAAARYGVTWREGRISLAVRGEHVKAFPEFGHRRAAKDAHYTWDAFCTLPGPEQSAIVAHHDLERKLEQMTTQEAKR